MFCFRRNSAVSVHLCVFAAILLLTGAALATVRTPDLTISLNPSVPSPELLGTSVTWTATISGGQQGHSYDYQFSTALQGQTQVVRDFNAPNSFVWVPWQVEGTYAVTVVARDITQQPYVVYAPVTAQYVIQPIVTNSGQSAVNITSHPLVALFSAGPCTAGHSIRVRFHPSGSQATSATNAVPCSSQSANFLVAGMLPSTSYEMHWEEFAPNFLNSGSDVSFTTGHLPSRFPAERFTVNTLPTQHDSVYPVVTFHLIPDIGRPFTYWPTATDLNGNVIWYFPDQQLETRSQIGGNFFIMGQMVLKEYDLAGHETLETNVGILNEQLAGKGYPIMSSFNDHETRRLPNGNLLLLGARDVASTQYQGGTQAHPVDILGDMILVLDHNLQLLWAWDAFAHQDLSREATLGETCVHDTAGCPAFSQQFTQANDWLHSNSVQLTPDGNLLLSERHQDWVLKVAYGNGHGDGHIIWRMGPYGDFTVVNPPHGSCGDPNVFPWFTHQHDAAFQPQGGITEVMTVFDDGNLRHSQCGGTGNSRGMILSVNEINHTVFLQTAADLGRFSPALGSAQLLSIPGSALYASFGDGLIGGNEGAVTTEVDLVGHVVYELSANDGSYRSYRLKDLYTPAAP
jgi:arylsulfate sulfotransferase